MQCEKERIIQVSLSKITDSRRRRGGLALRRNLLVSHVLNNVLTKTDAAYHEYRTTVEIDMEVETWDQDEQQALRESHSTTCTGASITTGNRTESPNTLCSVDETKGVSKPTVCSSKNSVFTDSKIINNTCSDMAVRDSKSNRTERTSQCKQLQSRVTGNKRSLYANDPCDNHVVCNKRLKYESSKEDENSCSDFPEPMDISSLVNVFSSSFAGLSSRTSNAKYEPFHSISSIASFPQTVEAF